MKKIIIFGRMIKFSHSVFALPFALSGAILASKFAQITVAKIGWVIWCMVAARTMAMAFNRLVDRKIDAQNPRTKNRELPAGNLSATFVGFVVLLSIIALVFGAWKLNVLTLILSPIAILILLGYSFTKRFTAFSHLVLGLSLAGAPVGAWIAITGNLVHLTPFVLGFAVLFWVAGFDIIYASQDLEFDKNVGLFSIPVRFGIKKSLFSAKILHFIALILLVVTGIFAQLGWIYFIGIAIVGGLLVYEHSLVSEENLNKLGVAFFTMNGIISTAFFVFVLLDFMLGEPL
ncbi:MAG: UbiA family prenyltransferase [Candidatus Marinimicrobia bacterium]|nr:UbiA family prenyltransferase [Candidatus Neomarinimicrobiota bacterium]